jgi:hypothetical protein
MKRTVDLPKMQMRAAIQPASLNAEARTVEIVWTTGSKGLRYGWDGSYYEELSLDPAHVRMARLESGNTPFLAVHDSWDLNSVIGVVEKAWLDGKEGRAVVRFADTEDVAQIWRKVQDGILRNVSVGYNVHTYERQPSVEGEDIPTYLAVDWEPCELSLVPVGFDMAAGVRSQENEKTPCILINDLPSQRNEEVSEMSKKIETAEVSTPAPAVDVEQTKREAAQAEKRRQSEIRTAVRAAQLEDSFADELIEGDVSIDQAREKIITKFAERGAPAVSSQVRVEAGAQDETKTRAEGMENALLHRFAPANYKLDDKGREFRSMSLIRMAEEVIGRKARTMTKSEIATRALTTSDFPNILANVASKTLRDGYKVVPQTFLPLITEGTLPDYKQASRIQMGDAPSLEAVGEDGEYKVGSIGDGAEKIQVAKFGKLLKIDERVIINDDVHAFTRVPSMMGAAASRLESKLFWDIFLNNPTMADSTALFHANHGNLGSASAINEAALTAMKKAMRAQKTLDGQDNLDLSPMFLICGGDKEVEALKMLSAMLVATKSTDVNVFSNSMKLIVENRITGNLWFGAADKNMVDTIERAYLEGMNGPEVSSSVDFDSDCLKLKVKHVVGFKAIDYRGLYKNPGA